VSQNMLICARPLTFPVLFDNVTPLVELGVVIGADGTDIKKEAAMDHVAGYVCALDLTARNIQSEAKKKGLPWYVLDIPMLSSTKLEA